MQIILFDGVCNLCNASVQWVLRHDKKAQFHFAPLQSDLGRSLMTRHGLDPDKIDTVVFIDGDKAYTRSDAALGVATRVGGIWTLMGVCYIFPRFIRNAVYNWIGRNRYRWFGREETCWLPRPEWKSRFLA